MGADVMGSILMGVIDRLASQWARTEYPLVSMTDTAVINDEKVVEWITDFVSLVEFTLRSGQQARSLDWSFDLEMPFGSFFGETLLFADGRNVSVRDYFREIAAPQLANGIASEVVSLFSRDEGQDAIDVQRVIAERGLQDANALQLLLLGPDVLEAIKNIVIKVTERELGACSLRSLYSKAVRSNGFREWSADMWTGEGVGQASRLVMTPFGQTHVQWARYDETDGGLVKAYEWMAHLSADAKAKVPDAGAMGMVYTLPKGQKRRRVRLQDLLEAADFVADVDVLQASAFITQYPDAKDLMMDSDLCFVWTWERREGSTAGAGTACLLAALDALGKRFASLKTVVVSVSPSQLHRCGAFGEPVQIEFERIEAMDKLQLLVEGLGSKTDLAFRSIVNRHEGSAASPFLAYACARGSLLVLPQ